MHYANGREAKLGDKIVSRDTSGNITSGIVVALYPGSDCCNLAIVPMAYTQSVNAKDSLHVEDAINAGVPRAQI